MPILRSLLIAVLAVSFGTAAYAAPTVTPVDTVEIASDVSGVAAFAILFDVSALEDTYLSASSTSYSFSVHGPEVNEFVSGLMSSAQKSGNEYVIKKGETEHFTLVIAAELGESGRYDAQLGTLSYSSQMGGALTTHRVSAAGFSTDDLYVAVGPKEEISGTIGAAGTELSGKAKGTDAVSVTIRNASGARVYGTGAIEVRSGAWSHEVDASLAPGEYAASVHDHVSGVLIATTTLEAAR